MKIETAERLIEAANQIGIEVLMHDYSGRYMFGAVTKALTVPNFPNWISLGATATCLIENESERSTFIAELSKMRIDTLGYDTVIY